MAFVDLHAAVAAGAEGHLDVTHRRFEPVAHELLPRGLAWDPEDPVRRMVVAADMTELSRVDVRIEALGRELDPHTTFSLVEDWEIELGLPECAKPVTLEARRAAILAKLLAEPGHSQGMLWWDAALEALGYPPKFYISGKDVFDCNDDCIDELTDEEWMFVWQIFVWNGVDDALVKCFVNKNALLGVLALVHFMWQPILVPEPATLAGVAATSDGYLAAVGAAAVILTAGADYDKADGTGWGLGTPDPGAIEDLFAVAAIDTTLVACGVSPANFYRSVDHGATWTAVATATEEMYAITQGIGAGVGLAAGENGTCWRTFDYGASWSAGTTITGAPTIRGLTCCGDGVTVAAVVAAGENGHIYRTVNSGTAWTDVYTAGAALHGVGAWELVVVAVGAGGKIVRSVDGGLMWAAVTSPTTATLRAVVGAPTDRWTAVGDGGVILQSLDAGATWSVQLSPTTENLRAVTRHVPSNRAVVVGANTSIIVE